MIDVYDLKLQKIKSIEFGEGFYYWYDSFMICDDKFYGAYRYSQRVDTFRFPNLKLTKSFSYNEWPLSQHFVRGYLILRYKYHLEYVDLKNGKTFQRAISNLDWSEKDWKMTAYDKDRLIFFNTKTDKIHISA